MNLMGYLVTLANIQSFAGPGGPPLTDISVRVSEVHRLAEELRALTEFPIDNFRATGFYRVGNVGIYVSNNLREFMYGGDVNPRDEGVILTLYFGKTQDYYGTEGTDGATTYLRTRAAEPAAESNAEAVADSDSYWRRKRSIIGAV